MSWIGVGVVGGLSLSAAGTGMSAISALNAKKKKGLSLPKPPDWYEDPYYKKTQDRLYDEGTKLLEGKPGEYYAPLGEVGGSMFEDVIAKSTRDITGAVNEDAAKRGMGRSGATSNAIARAVGDKTTELRWSDFLRAMQGRASFLELGNNMVSGVRSAGLTYQGQKNNFNLASTGYMADSAVKQYEADQIQSGQQAAAKGNFFGSLIEGGMSLAQMSAYLGKTPTTTNTASTPKLDIGKADIMASPKSKYLSYEFPFGRE